MAQTKPRRGPLPAVRSYRWTLHLAVLAIVAGVMFAGLRERIGGSDQIPPTERALSRPTEPSPLAVALPVVTPSPSPLPTPVPTATASPAPVVTPAPTPEPTPDPTPEAIPAPTPEPVPQPVPTRAVAAAPPPPAPRPAPTAAPRPAPTAAPPPAPTTVIARAVDFASLRAGPGTDASIIASVPAGSTAAVIGCSAGCSWLQIAIPSGIAWTARHFWVVTGDLSRFGGR